MSVKWIKITTDMFEDEKIDYIESLPEADAVLIVWVKLLTLAGKSNAKGYILLTENIPYTEDMLAHKFRRPLNTVRFALETFRRLGMIDADENGIFIDKWEKHQNIEGMEKIREQERLRKRKQREKQRLLEVSRDSHGTVTQSHATDIEEELDIDIDKEKKKKIKVADFVTLTSEEQKNLVEKLGEEKAADMIEALNLWKGSKGKKTKSDYMTILSWRRREEKENKAKGSSKIESNRGSHENPYEGYDFGF